MNEKISIWTKQHKNIMIDLEENSRYIAKKEYIKAKMEEHSDPYLDVYNWYAEKADFLVKKPSDVKYPIWVSLSEDSHMGLSEGNVIIEATVNKSDVIILNLEKWGYIVNYLYIPKDEKDLEEHEKILENYGLDDTGAYMSPFYPNIKNKIIKSWDRLFDDTISIGDEYVGTIWELKKEWITKIIQ